ncbi:hypothetical protein [Flagellimonas myxillae]|uniref:hypothetical protein n=1 Tax=Flagellimonas myxillae TaxID=2942214 RepID=UPI00201EA074|nr:hypothetical protein [Muricauda myxillae]MCL6264861.1 hypothetical protein [Muricauda myxillae]
MRKLSTYILLAIGFVSAVSCTEEKIVDQVQKTVERGLVLRTVANLSTTYNLLDPSSTFGVTLEAQDEENGGLLSEVRVYAQFVDNTVEDDNDLSSDEALVSTISASTFTEGPFGFPRADLVVTLSEALTGTGTDAGIVDGGDAISFRLEAQLTDGRVFTNRAAGTVANGSFFSSPFAYSAGINCIPVTPVTGDYQLNLTDLYGDGWDGAFITVTIDGTDTQYTIAAGSAAAFTISVPDGTTELVFAYTPGAFEEEHVFELLAPSGETAAAGGPGPTPGEIVLNICS